MGFDIPKFQTFGQQRPGFHGQNLHRRKTRRQVSFSGLEARSKTPNREVADDVGRRNPLKMTAADPPPYLGGCFLSGRLCRVLGLARHKNPVCHVQWWVEDAAQFRRVNGHGCDLPDAKVPKPNVFRLGRVLARLLPPLPLILGRRTARDWAHAVSILLSRW